MRSVRSPGSTRAMRARASAAEALPGRRAVGLDLTLPDRQVGLDRLDDRAADLERLGAVRRRDRDHDGGVADVEPCRSGGSPRRWRAGRPIAVRRDAGAARPRRRDARSTRARRRRSRHPDRDRARGRRTSSPPRRRRRRRRARWASRSSGSALIAARRTRAHHVVSPAQLIEHVARDREHDRHAGCHARRATREVHDERAVRVDDSGDAARQHPGRLLGGAAPAELLGDARAPRA